MSITIRPYRAADAQEIAELYNRHPDNPNPVAGGIGGAELERELAERDTAVFLVAEDAGRVVGTFGLFHSTGRRTARSGELIADMFFVAPAYRGGMVTGRLFTEAVEQTIATGCLVLRLTVNPANAVAFKLYRRVGCVSVGQPVPGEDGNIELHNYLPLVLRTLLADCGPEVREALSGLSSFGNVTEARDDRLRSDVRVVDRVRTVPYRIAAHPYRLEAVVDVDRGAVLEAELTGPDEGTRRKLRIAEPPYRVRQRRPSAPYRFAPADGRLACEVDDVDGTVRVFADGHLGPVLTSTWPSCEPGRTAGWRESQPLELELEPVADGVRVVERHEGKQTVGTVTLTDGVLRQEFATSGAAGRIFQTIGLRQGTLRRSGADDPEPEPANAGPGGDPLGLGLAVRDSSEVVAASWLAEPGGELAWTGDALRIGVPVRERIRLVHSTLIERRLEPAADGVARLRTELRVLRSAPGDARTLRIEPAAGGVVGWTQGSTKVLRSPYPRTRPFGHNPHWSAGMWVTTERSRFSQDSGVGWGLPSAAEWVAKHPLGLFEPQERIGWELTAPTDPARPVTVRIQAPEAREEIVLWLTPNCPKDTAVVVESAGVRHELGSADFRQLWAANAAVRLADGRWLECRPAEDAPGHPELVLRATDSGLLIGCVTAAGALDGAEAAWRFTVRDRAGT